MTPRRPHVIPLRYRQSRWRSVPLLPIRRRRRSLGERLRALPGLLPTIETTILALASGLLLWAAS